MRDHLLFHTAHRSGLSPRFGVAIRPCNPLLVGSHWHGKRMVQALMLSLALWAGLVLPAAHAQSPDVLRPQLATPLQSVQALLAAGKPQEALVTLRDIERKISDRSLYENYMIERLKAATAVALSDDAAAVAALEASLKTEKASAAERVTIWAQLAGLSLKLKDVDGAGRWAAAYVQGGGQDDNVRAVLVRSALGKGDCATVVEQLALILAATERRGEKPPEGQLRASVACQAKLGQDDAYFRDLERLLGHHPKPEYWADLIARLQRRPGFADRLLLDSFRLMRHVGAMEDADDFLSAAQLAIRAALPGEALQFLKAGFDAGVLGKGPAASTQRDLLARVTREAAADKAQLPDAQKQADDSVESRRQFLAGQAAWSHGQTDVGVQLMQRALARGITRDPDDARLHLALALASAGRKDEARKLFAGLPPRDGLADLGRLWLLALR